MKVHGEGAMVIGPFPKLLRRIGNESTRLLSANDFSHLRRLSREDRP
jgi:hypothetical protein